MNICSKLSQTLLGAHLFSAAIALMSTSWCAGEVAESGNLMTILAPTGADAILSFAGREGVEVTSHGHGDPSAASGAEGLPANSQHAEAGSSGAEIVLDLLFADIAEDLWQAPAGALAGQRLLALVEAPRATRADDTVHAMLREIRNNPVELGRIHTLAAQLLELPGIESEGNRRVVEFRLPSDAGAGFAELIVEVAGLKSATFPLEITTPDALEVRKELASLAAR